MSNVPESAGNPPAGPPLTPPPPPTPGMPPGPGAYRPLRPPPPPPRNGTPLLGCALAFSMALNLLAGLLLILGCMGLFALKKPDTSGLPLTEHHYSGRKGAGDKIAIISVEGVILEGLLSYVHKQIEQAAEDKQVKAVVLRVDSPGGSVTGSDDIHRRLIELRDGNPKKGHGAKPLVVSMGAIAASGGYYVAVPGQPVFAEPTTLTGSIGVYTSFLNVKQLGDKYGVALNIIKQGQIKDSGSPFADMTAHEKQVWQDLVDDAYQRFLQVVEKGRPVLAGGKLLRPLDITPIQAGPDFLKKDKKREPYQRYLADGGVWTADKALKYQLIDRIGSLDDAVQAAHDAAQFGEDYRAIKYERPSILADLLGLGSLAQPASAGNVLDPARLQAGVMPRLWYLAPGAEAAGFLAATRE